VITVIGPVGDVVTVSVAQAVPLHHLRVRDEVTVDYRQQVVLEQRRGAGVPKTHDSGQTIAEIETGDMGLNAPTAAAQTSIEFTARGGERIYRTEGFSATIKDVNRAHRVLILYGEHGQTRKISVGPEIDLDMVEPGDRVVVLITETEAINVRRR
jgi:hypothetical protein